MADEGQGCGVYPSAAVRLSEGAISAVTGLRSADNGPALSGELSPRQPLIWQCRALIELGGHLLCVPVEGNCATGGCLIPVSVDTFSVPYTMDTRRPADSTQRVFGVHCSWVNLCSFSPCWLAPEGLGSCFDWMDLKYLIVRFLFNVGRLQSLCVRSRCTEDSNSH